VGKGQTTSVTEPQGFSFTVKYLHFPGIAVKLRRFFIFGNADKFCIDQAVAKGIPIPKTNADGSEKVIAIVIDFFESGAVKNNAACYAVTFT
jgi:hypothetical protein